MNTVQREPPKKEHSKVDLEAGGIQLPKLPQHQSQDSGCKNGSDGGCSVRSWTFSNMYASKKTVAQGMMDIALLTANANQLRQHLEYDQPSTTFYVILVLILISMCLQVVVGVFLIFKGRYKLRRKKEKRTERLNNYVVMCVFMITVINIFIAAFSLNGITPVAVK